MTKASSSIKSKVFKTAIQLLLTVAALAIVLSKTDTNRLASLIGHANPWHLLGAILFFNISKIVNAVRLNRFFTSIGLQLSAWYNLKLYYLGMFYNLFLPGGIGGDGYKIYVLKKNHGLTVINIFNAVFWDRVSGIFALIFLSALLIIPSSFAALYPGEMLWIWVIAGVAYPLSLLLTWLFYRQFMPVFIVTAFESLVIQATQVISAWFILMAMSATAHQIDYLAIFLISSVATILPLTVGGAGAREVTFFYALNHLGLDVNTGIALSLIFFAISAISSLVGILAKIKHEPGHSLASK
ncbi:lysylphosphatidylglycerol synthase transmembrane domain-containing protein [Chlorobaculum sp. 24CR]|uniref:lysylphosphatidylglycerol synthase transmembrane domain-containing protein n=1 Tax=Chlorobaculum sp. 24CR TaxID=2508878 RepID=UPI0014306247|nr:lysylphosphatidylglycerol synthase transmembrane domain-containing protein [Chlorobaculum sp. 24CR]